MENKDEQYQLVLNQAKALMDGESDTIANLANVSALLKETFNFWWVGFYLRQNDELVLGPFQGPVACTRIPKGKGVCGDAFELKKSIKVDNVHEYPGHIACSSASNSELVVPLFDGDEVVGVLDIDSENYEYFDQKDQSYMEQLCSLISHKCFE